MLPHDATPDSHRLFALAQQLLDHCPGTLYAEVSVSGSVSRGVADRFSDVDINFWVDTLEPIATYQAWIEPLGAKAGRPGWLQGDEKYHLEYTIGGAKYDLIWQSWGGLERDLAPLDAMTLPDDRTLPWMLFHSIPLGDAPRFKSYQARVATYPEPLRRQIIREILSIWRWMLNVPDIFFATAQVARPQVHDLRRRQLMGIDGILALLFAYNRIWQPDFKWLAPESKHLTHQPPRLLERIDFIFTSADLPATAQTVISLIVDTLAILADEFDVDDLIQPIKVRLDKIE